MSRRPLAPEAKAALVEALRDVFRAKGWDGASLTDLAAASGLSRATLYHHFPNGKADMAAAALADVEARLDAQLLAPLKGDGPPRVRFAAMCGVLDAFYRGGDLGCLLGGLSHGAREHGLGARVAAGFDAWADAMRDLAIEAGVAPRTARDNAIAAIAALQGSLVMATATRSRDPFRSTLERLPDLLFAKAAAGALSTTD